MNELHKAYAVLGLEPGASMESIMRRYKRLIMVWHPDRAPSQEHREFAEEELKKINNAKDLLTKHFNGNHKASGCECQPGATAGAGASRASQSSSAGPGPRYHRQKTADEKQQEEEAARNRDAERKRREEEEANRKRAEQAYQQTQSQQTMESAMQQQKALQDEKLRWQISIGIIIAFVGLEIFGSMAMGLKSWWHDFTWKWQNEHSTKPPDSGSSTGTNTGTTPYIPPYDRTPGGDVTTWQREQEQAEKERKEREQKQHDQDVYFTKLEIDKYEKIIEHCNSELTKLEMQIADPYVSEIEKNKLRDMRDFRQKNLAEAQDNLKIAQDKLASLTGTSAPQPVPSFKSPFSSPFSTDRPGIPLVPVTPSNSSPFGPPADPNATSISPPSTTTGGLSGLTTPSSPPSLSELMKKYADVAPKTDNTSTGSFFGKKDGLGNFNSQPSTKLSDLLKKYSTDQNSSTSTNSGN